MARKEKYEVRVMPAAVKQMRKLDGARRTRLDQALRHLASEGADGSGSRGGKSLKQLRGRHDRFFRLRVGDLRVVLDLQKEDRVLRVHAVVKRADLERWLRNDRRSTRSDG